MGMCDHQRQLSSLVMNSIPRGPHPPHFSPLILLYLTIYLIWGETVIGFPTILNSTPSPTLHLQDNTITDGSGDLLSNPNLKPCHLTIIESGLSRFSTQDQTCKDFCFESFLGSFSSHLDREVNLYQAD